MLYIIKSDGFAYFDLRLQRNNKFTIYYEYKGMYPQFTELNTRSNTTLTDKLEYLLLARIKMIPNKNPKTNIFYRDNPLEAEFGDVCKGQ